MVYAKKRNSRPARYRMSKRTAGIRKVVTDPKKAIMSLSKQVKSLKKQISPSMENETYWNSHVTDVAEPYVAYNLCNYSSWTRAWPTTLAGVDRSRGQMYHKFFSLDNLVTLDNINNEEGTINFTYFVMSRRDEASTATDTGATLSLSAGVDYVQGPGNGMVYLNLRKWKVHYCKRFTLTQMDIDGADASSCQKRFYTKIRVGKMIKAPDSSWKSLDNSPDPSDTYYAVLFNDNSTVDLENPLWKMTVVHSVTE